MTDDSTVPQYNAIYTEAFNNALEIAAANEKLQNERERMIYAMGYADGAVVASRSAVEAIEKA